MKRLLISCALLACACAGPRELDLAVVPEAERRLLVTLELGQAGRLPAAGSTARPYTSVDGYDVPERTRLLAGRIARDHRLQSVDDWPIELIGVHCIVVEVPAGRAIDEVIAGLERDARVESVQRMQWFRALGASEDPYLDLQHGLDSMRVPEAHRWADGRGARIAVIDTAVDTDHPDLQIALYRDFVEGRGARRAERHGTAVAGIIVSEPDNGIGTVGVAPGASLHALRACWERPDDPSGICNSFTLARALAFAADRDADIINLSLTGPRDPLLERLVVALQRGGAIVVTADPGETEPGFPDAIDGVFVVRAAGEGSDGFAAPGEDVLAAVPGDGFDYVSGSSFAAAHVSGLLALLLQHAPDADGARLHAILRGASDGTAVVDACRALSQVSGQVRCDRPLRAGVEP